MARERENESLLGERVFLLEENKSLRFSLRDEREGKKWREEREKDPV